MGLLATPFAAHAAIAAPAPAVRVGAPAAGRLGAVWPTRLSAPWPLPDAGIAVAGRPARLFTEGAVAVVRGVTAADVAAGLRYLAARIEQGAGRWSAWTRRSRARPSGSRRCSRRPRRPVAIA
jgi:hypothetical protein